MPTNWGKPSDLTAALAKMDRKQSMAYLDSITTWWRRVVDCPTSYPYALVVEYEVGDRYAPLKPDDVFGLAVKAAIPDVEEWQFSVVKLKNNRVKFRFRTDGQRTLARNALEAGAAGVELAIKRLSSENLPD